MKIYISGYFSTVRGRFHEPSIIHRLRQIWINFGVKLRSQIIFIEPGPYQIHGEVLRKIWTHIESDRILNNPKDQTYVISEIDFIPNPACLDNWEALCDNLLGRPIGYFTSFLSRRCDQGAGLEDHWPLTAPWFLALNLRGSTSSPPLDWLDATGPRNDAANLAGEKALASGFLLRENLIQVPYRDLRPSLMSIELPAYGFHSFFSACFEEPPSYELLPGTGYTVGEHLDRLTRFLDRQGFER